MKKTTITLLLAVGCCYSALLGQNLATWNLTNNATATYQSNHTNAGKLTRGNGITPIDFTPNGASASAWESSVDVSAADFYEICLKPKPGYMLDISSLTFTEMRTADGIRSYRLKWSLDGFQTFNVLADVPVPDVVTPRTATHPNLDIGVCDGQELCIRWYGYNAEAYNGEWYLSNVIITGTESPACNPPGSPPSNLAISNITSSTMDVAWTPGGADATLVLAREGSPVEIMLCGGNTYSADPTFGQGSDLGNGAFVVFNGPGSAFTMDGLEDGATYHLLAIGYNSADNCLQKNNLPVASAATLCGKPTGVDKLMNSPSDQQVSLAWEAPLCYDQVMVVASSQTIASMPTSPDANVYITNPVFSPGAHGSADFTNDEALVYRGVDTKAAITGLNNDQPYFFKIFTFQAGIWTAGAEVMVNPKAGCSFLGGDFIYINELHFTNKNTEIDKGIEIAGLAGINLENYVLAIYNIQSNLERIIPLTGVIDDEGQGYGAIWVPDPDLFFASAIALVNQVTGVTTDFVAHRIYGVVANDGPAAGQPAFWQGVNEDPNTAVNYSIQRQGDIACPNTSQVWAGPALSSRGQLNFVQTVFPITLLSFEGEPQGERVLLTWKTETEENNDYMAVEYSTDARRFTEIGQVKGAGTTTEPQVYHLWHDQPQPGLNYYRLRQVDFDGAFTYHGLIAIEYEGKGAGIQVYPSLATEQLTIRMAAPAARAGALLICDLNGRLVQQLATAPGFIHQGLDVSLLPPGPYILQWRSDNGELLTDRFVKL